ncbi:MAG: hypothetical protein COZ95_07515, partial [Nitrospirae bacterium CG_4_8_14_3_um_filter_50_41]
YGSLTQDLQKNRSEVLHKEVRSFLSRKLGIPGDWIVSLIYGIIITKKIISKRVCENIRGQGVKDSRGQVKC